MIRTTHTRRAATGPSTTKAATGCRAQMPSAIRQQQWQSFHAGTGPRQG